MAEEYKEKRAWQNAVILIFTILTLWPMYVHTALSNHHQCGHEIPRSHEVIHDVYIEPEHVVRKRSIDQSLRIHLHYHDSVDSLPRDQRILIKEEVLPKAVKYWESTLKVRHTSAPIKLRRKCAKGFIQYNRVITVDGSESGHEPYCVISCLQDTQCGEISIPAEHLEACYTCRNTSTQCTQVGPSGIGVRDADFILYVSAVQSDRCQVGTTVAYAAHCQLEKALDRPVAGYINICPVTISTAEFDLHQTVSTVKHEILHALGFTAGLYAFYRDKSGRPLTPRENGTSKPPLNKLLGIYEWSDAVVKRFTRPAWRVASGTIRKEVQMIVTPRVQEEVRKHFNCPTLEGAELEDQGIMGTAITHWEKRVFENEAMTGTYTQNPTISRITLALMEDTGWYSVNYSNAEQFIWGKNLGCDFVTKSCMDWIVAKQEKREDIHPFCNRPREGILQTECTMNRDSVALCNLVQYPDNQPVPTQYQYFNQIPGLANAKPSHFGGSVVLADYCPFIQEFTWKFGKSSLRTSRCTHAVNNADPNTNYLVEKYGRNSKCFNHNGLFKLQHCDEITTPQHGGSGCHEYHCSNRTGLSLIVNGKTHKCFYTGQEVQVFSTSPDWLHLGKIICPPCPELCKDKGIVCPAEVRDPVVNVADTPPKAPCFGTISSSTIGQGHMTRLLVSAFLLSTLIGHRCICVLT